MEHPQYEAQTRLLLTTLAGVEQGDSGVDRQAPIDPALFSSQVEVLRSHDLARRVAARNQLEKDSEFNMRLRSLSPLQHLAVLTGVLPNPTAVPVSEQVVSNLRARLAVQPVGGVQMVGITFRSEDPAKAAQLANDLGAAYIDWLAASRAAKTAEHDAQPAPL
jgi:succinoglycan biosynthesis transport protein ExoP